MRYLPQEDSLEEGPQRSREMLTSTLVSKLIDVLAHTDLEDNPDFMTVVNDAVDTTYTALNIEGARPMCQSKTVAFTPDETITVASSEPPKKKRGWPKGKPRKPRPAPSTQVIQPPAATQEGTLVEDPS